VEQRPELQKGRHAAAERQKCEPGGDGGQGVRRERGEQCGLRERVVAQPGGLGRPRARRSVPCAACARPRAVSRSPQSRRRSAKTRSRTGSRPGPPVPMPHRRCAARGTPVASPPAGAACSWRGCRSAVFTDSGSRCDISTSATLRRGCVAPKGGFHGTWRRQPRIDFPIRYPSASVPFNEASSPPRDRAPSQTPACSL